MCPSTWCFGSLLMLLCCAHLVRSDYYTRLYDSHRRGGHNRGSPRIRLSTPVPLVSGFSPGRHAGPRQSGAIPRGQYYSRLFGRLRGNRGFRKIKGEFAHPPFVSSSSSSSSSSTTSFSDIPIPPEIAAMIPPGGTINDIPKSQLAVLTGDPDYTRFRQLFLRQMCRRLLDGPRASSFQFCLSILAL